MQADIDKLLSGGEKAYLYSKGDKTKTMTSVDCDFSLRDWNTPVDGCRPTWTAGQSH